MDQGSSTAEYGIDGCDESPVEDGLRVTTLRRGRPILGLLLVWVFAAASCGGNSPSTPDDDDDQDGIRTDPVTGFQFGVNDYTEYRPGTLPIILSAPHGGALEPGSIPNRSGAGIVTVTDSRTIETTLAAAAAIEARFGARPHVIISHLRRTKLDPNRDIDEAALGNAEAERAWREYHTFIDSASAAVERSNGNGIYLDMHGHGHPIQRLELGVLITTSELVGFSDDQFDALDGEGTSLEALAARTTEPFSEILRGAESFGSLLDDRGVPAVPSETFPHPDDPATPELDPYFNGGYSTARHGSRDGGTVDGIQIEHHFGGVRDNDANRAAYGAALAEVLEIWIDRYYSGG